MDDDIIATRAWLDQEDRRIMDIVRTHRCCIEMVLADEDQPHVRLGWWC